MTSLTPEQQSEVVSLLETSGENLRALLTELNAEDKAAGATFEIDDLEEYERLLEELHRIGAHELLQFIYEGIGTQNKAQSRATNLYLESIKHTPDARAARLLQMLQPEEKEKEMHAIFRQTTGQSIVRFLIFLVSVLLLVFIVYSWSGGVTSWVTKKQFGPVEKETTVTFADVKGNIEAKEELQDIEDYLRDPARFGNVKVPKGVLMIGPPGTGKTLLARALAGEAGVPFLTCSGSEFEEIFVGVGAKRIRQLFTEARSQAPCIIFIDEIDAVGGARDKQMGSHAQMSLNQLLVELDGFNSRDGIILIGATNMPDALDKALIRPGRFDRKVFLSLPELGERQEIIDLYLKKFDLDPNVNSLVLARQTPGMSGADLENLVNWAALESVKENKLLDMEQLEKALLNVAMGREKKCMLLSDKVKKLTAYHEGGHALVALKVKNGPEIRKATLIPRGGALGMVASLPSDENMITKSELEGKLAMAMGGRAAEELIFGIDNVTTGAGSDFEGATRIAYAMVTQLGMSRIGHAYVEQHVNPFTGETRIDLAGDKEAIEDEVHEILEKAYRNAFAILQENEPQLHLLATALLKYETLDKEEIEKVICGVPLTLKDETRALERLKLMGAQAAAGGLNIIEF